MTDRLAASTNSYHTYSLEEALNGIAKAGFKSVELTSVPGWTEHVRRDATEEELAYVKEHAPWIVGDEVFVAVAAGADGGAHTGAHSLLQSFGCVVRCEAEFDTTRSIRFRGGPAKVVALLQYWKARVLRHNGDRHVAP